MPRFTVDTHLFRELGELLVGRDSTALIELIKNAYDAEATRVNVYGQRLDSPEDGAIVVADDGVGMTEGQFTSGFLRVASRFKDQGDRRSVRYRRRYTGVKGIGRLAAHKLARILEIESVCGDVDGGQHLRSLHAVIDWDAIERHPTLDDLGRDVVPLETRTSSEGAHSGTTLTLSKLRRAWSSVERARFFTEVQAFEPPTFLQAPLPVTIVGGPLLFKTPFVRDDRPDQQSTSGGFRVSLEGDFAAGEEYWDLVAGVASWVLEIRAAPGDRVVRFAIAPTKKTAAVNPAAKSFETEIPHPNPAQGPFFDARVMVREGQLRIARDQRVWASRSSGIRVYLEGFRVLPYGDDDWLALDANYTRRTRTLEALTDLHLTVDNVDPDEALTRLPGNNYFGGVFLTQERAPTLRILVNREGFVPEAGFDTLVKLVRTGVDLCTRVRAAAQYAERQQRKKERKRVSLSGSLDRGETEVRRTDGAIGGRLTLPNLVDDAVRLSHRARTLVGEGKLETARQVISDMEGVLDRTKERAAEAISEQSLLRVLASVGAQMAAFVHEVSALLGTAQTVEQAMERLMASGQFTAEQRRTLRRTLAAANDLRRGLERHASYLIDVVTPDARRRRSRQPLAERYDAAVRLVQHQAARRGIEIENAIPADAKSPPMFPAELTTTFANLLTNAVKAVGENGRICASVTENESGLYVRIQNTGVAVDLKNSERWFSPFESTTWEVDPVLGQGMGLGLTITRNVLASYGATVSFVEPDQFYSTAVEIVFPR